jgi:hypothetical protein
VKTNTIKLHADGKITGKTLMPYVELFLRLVKRVASYCAMELKEYALLCHRITSHQPLEKGGFRPQFKNLLVLSYIDSNKNVIKL